jgi:hypothetical protein
MFQILISKSKLFFFNKRYLYSQYFMAISKHCLKGNVSFGRAIAQAVSRWLSTTAARVRARVWQVGFMVDKVSV